MNFQDQQQERSLTYMYLFTNLVTHKTLMLLLSCKREGKKDSAKLIQYVFADTSYISSENVKSHC